MKKLRSIFGLRLSPSCVRGRPLQLSAQRVFVKDKSQLCAWMTSAAECAEGFVKDKSQLCAWTTSAAEYAEGFGR